MLAGCEKHNLPKNAASSSFGRPPATTYGPPGDPILQSQWTFGNQTHAPIQAKLTVHSPGDAYEQEADRISDEVLRRPEAELTPACACGGTCTKCRPGHAERPPRGSEDQGRPDWAERGRRPRLRWCMKRSRLQPGHVLDAATRASMERRFGHDFGTVRVHADDEAADSAQALGARAYTVGRDVVFGKPGSTPPVRARDENCSRTN